MTRSRTRSSSSAPPEPTFFTDRDLGRSFGRLLKEAGLNVEVHAEHFPESEGVDGTPDEIWLPFVGEQGWVLLTHDKSMRHRSRERDAIMSHGVRAFMLMGEHTAAAHADNVLQNLHLLERTLRRQPGAFIAKLYHPSPRDRERKLSPKGRVELWLVENDWRLL